MISMVGGEEHGEKRNYLYARSKERWVWSNSVSKRKRLWELWVSYTAIANEP